ncbi:hypothetical protein HK104_009870, partial [Borealophlyctis nickersoniae]
MDTADLGPASVALEATDGSVGGPIPPLQPSSQQQPQPQQHTITTTIALPIITSYAGAPNPAGPGLSNAQLWSGSGGLPPSGTEVLSHPSLPGSSKWSSQDNAGVGTQQQPQNPPPAAVEHQVLVSLTLTLPSGALPPGTIISATPVLASPAIPDERRWSTRTLPTDPGAGGSDTAAASVSSGAVIIGPEDAYRQSIVRDDVRVSLAVRGSLGDDVGSAGRSAAGMIRRDISFSNRSDVHGAGGMLRREVSSLSTVSVDGRRNQGEVDAQRKESPEEYLKKLMCTVGQRERAKLLAKNDDFHAKVRACALQPFTFKDMSIDIAIRHFLHNFLLPVESQEIDRVLKSFAIKYHEDNPNLFASADDAHTLAFAIVLLNSDQHNPANTRHKMTCAQFIANCKSCCTSAPPEVLEIIYDNIKHVPLQYAKDDIDPVTGGVLIERYGGWIAKVVGAGEGKSVEAVEK